MKNCKECGTEFKPFPQHGGAMYCGEDCRKIVRSRVNIANKNRRHERMNGGDVEFIARDIYNKYKQRSPSRGLEFSLSLDFFIEHVNADCYYCQNPIGKVGFDRIDNHIGYIESNCVPCCVDCNLMKRAMSPEKFIQKCIDIADRFLNVTQLS